MSLGWNGIRMSISGNVRSEQFFAFVNKALCEGIRKSFNFNGNEKCFGKKEMTILATLTKILGMLVFNTYRSVPVGYIVNLLILAFGTVNRNHLLPFLEPIH